MGGLLGTGAENGASTGTLDNSIRDLPSCAERTRESTSETTDLNCLGSITTDLMNLLLGY